MSRITSWVASWTGSRKFILHLLAMLGLTAGLFTGNVNGTEYAAGMSALATSFSVGNGIEHFAERGK